MNGSHVQIPTKNLAKNLVRITDTSWRCKVSESEKNTVIVSGFPGIGKTHFFNSHSDQLSILDSDSSGYSKSPDFPNNYIKHIKDNMGKVDVILVSSHKEIRDAMDKAGVSYSLVIPDISLKSEYVKRYIERGSPEALVSLIDKNWDTWLSGLEVKNLFILYKGQYLSDVWQIVTEAVQDE